MEPMLKAVKAVADTHRLRTLALLHTAGECCVCDVQMTLDVSLSTASRALKQLEEAGWTQTRRDGRWIYSRLFESLSPWQRELIEELTASQTATEDYTRYKAKKAKNPVCETN